MDVFIVTDPLNSCIKMRYAKNIAVAKIEPIININIAIILNLLLSFYILTCLG